MKAKELLLEFYNPEDDQMFKREISDTRRPKLTLRHLHKLRKMRDLEALDNKNREEFVKQMYSSPAE